MASLRQAVEGADAKAVIKALREGAQQKKWTLDRCGVEQARSIFRFPFALTRQIPQAAEA